MVVFALVLYNVEVDVHVHRQRNVLVNDVALLVIMSLTSENLLLVTLLAKFACLICTRRSRINFKVIAKTILCSFILIQSE